MTKELNGFDEDYATRDGMISTLDFCFKAASGWFVEKYGRPLSEWRYVGYDGDWMEAATGIRIRWQEYRDGEFHELPGALDGWAPVCDGKRDQGGSFERFLGAHWALRTALDELDCSIGGFIAQAVAYGWALANLSMDVPALRAVSPSEIVVVPEKALPANA